MTIRHETRAAIAALPGKTVQPWRDGDARCHCTHCDLCGDIFATEVFSRHEDECQAALLKALADAKRVAELEERIDDIRHDMLERGERE